MLLTLIMNLGMAAGASAAPVTDSEFRRRDDGGGGGDKVEQRHLTPDQQYEDAVLVLNIFTILNNNND